MFCIKGYRSSLRCVQVIEAEYRTLDMCLNWLLDTEGMFLEGRILK